VPYKAGPGQQLPCAPPFVLPKALSQHKVPIWSESQVTA
jgi:hypothetical protein